jgi:hypothetical protein
MRISGQRVIDRDKQREREKGRKDRKKETRM